MKLIIPHSLEKEEFLANEKIFPLEVIKQAAIKAVGGMGKTIKSSKKISGTSLKKISLTSTGGAGRILFLLQIGPKKSILVMLRLKNDKKIGTNMSMQNKRFEKLLTKNLELIIKDLRARRYDEHELS